jgi:putative protease
MAVNSSACLAPSTTQGLDHGLLSRQLGRLGGSGWQLAGLELDLEPGLFLPIKELNTLRRQLVQQLDPTPGETDRMQSAPESDPSGEEQANTVLQHLLRDARGPEPPEPGPPQLHVLVRSLEQLRALRGLELASVLVDLEQPTDLREAVAIGAGCWPGGVWLAGPRICRPDERWTLEPLLRAQPSGYLVRNADQLETLRDRAPCVGDFSLNIANPLTAAYFLERWGLKRVTASPDLALDQLLELSRGIRVAQLEVTVHQHMPLFHMEHCLFCSVLSSGHDHTDCGRPCERHTVTLRDRSGVDHPLKADLGCRNTLFNGRAQTAAEALPSLLEAGIRHLRLELLNENGAETQQRVRTYQECLQGRLSGLQLWQQEQLISQLGVTRGTLKRRREAPEGTGSLR